MKVCLSGEDLGGRTGGLESSWETKVRRLEHNQEKRESKEVDTWGKFHNVGNSLRERERTRFPD
jgi:hypothetical protein